MAPRERTSGSGKVLPGLSREFIIRNRYVKPNPPCIRTFTSAGNICKFKVERVAEARWDFFSSFFYA